MEKLTFDYRWKHQCFALPQTLITYILNSPSPKIRYNLFISCKLMFTQKPTPICQQLEIGPFLGKSEYRQQSIRLQNPDMVLPALSNLYVVDRLDFRYSCISMLSTIIPKLSHCEARFIQIRQQIITINDLKFLSSPKLEKFFYINGGITNSDGNVADLEAILQQLESANYIR